MLAHIDCMYNNQLWCRVFQERNGLTKGYDSLKLELNEAKVSICDAHMLAFQPC